MQVIIDRFEGELAIIEYAEGTFSLPRSLLPQKATEGDVLQISIRLDKNATNQRQNRLRQLMDDVFES